MVGGILSLINPFVKARVFDGVYICKKCKRKTRWNKKKGVPKCRYCGSTAMRVKRLPIMKKK